MRNALVTGGSGGIGQACGRRLVELGYDVVLTARREEPLRAAAADMGARFVVADATDPEKFAPAVEAIGEIDLLVHAAGILGGETDMLQDVPFEMYAIRAADVAEAVAGVDTLDPSVDLPEIRLHAITRGPSAREPVVPLEVERRAAK